MKKLNGRAFLLAIVAGVALAIGLHIGSWLMGDDRGRSL